MNNTDAWPDSAVSSDQARSHWSQTLDRVHREPVTITHRGRERAVIVNPEWFQRAVEAIKDIEDIEAARAARDDVGESISHEELMRELGLDPK